MTREEVISILERVDICANAAETARDMALDALREQEMKQEICDNHWISVKDRLPKEFVPVIVCRRSPKIGIVVEQGYKDVRDWWRVPGCKTKAVTHWMPFPKPPKEVEHG